MSDYSKLKKLATTCSIARISGWRGQMGVDEREILALIAENDRLKDDNRTLRRGMSPGYDLDAWIDWSKEAEALRSVTGECKSYLQCVVDKSMSRNNAEALADELISAIDAAMSKEPEPE